MLEPQASGPKAFAPLWYRLAHLLAFGGFLYTVFATDWPAYWRTLWGEQPSPHLAPVLITNLIWLASIAPLEVLAFHLGIQNTSARRLNMALWKGHVSAWQIAWRGLDPSSLAAEYSRPPRENHLAAWAWGIGAALLPPVFFSAVMSDLRTPPALLWLGGTGVLFGVAAYSNRRAVVYLRDEPGALDVFRNWRLLQVDRYEAAGRPFVRAQQVCAVLLPIWWLGGGALIIG